MYINEIETRLDKDGELPVVVPTSMSDDVTVYVRERDMIEMASVFGYALVPLPTTPTESKE